MENLPACRFRFRANSQIICRSPRLRGYPLDIINERVCQLCVTNWGHLYENIEPKPAPLVVFGVCGRVFRITIENNFWKWGTAIKRLIRVVTFGLARENAGCGCEGRRAKLDELGDRLHKWLVSFWK